MFDFTWNCFPDSGGIHPNRCSSPSSGSTSGQYNFADSLYFNGNNDSCISFVVMVWILWIRLLIRPPRNEGSSKEQHRCVVTTFASAPLGKIAATLLFQAPAEGRIFCKRKNISGHCILFSTPKWTWRHSHFLLNLWIMTICVEMLKSGYECTVPNHNKKTGVFTTVSCFSFAQQLFFGHKDGVGLQLSSCKMALHLPVHHGKKRLCYCTTIIILLKTADNEQFDLAYYINDRRCKT